MAYIHEQHKQLMQVIIINCNFVHFCGNDDRQQTLQKVDIQIRSAGITLKEGLQEQIS